MGARRPLGLKGLYSSRLRADTLKAEGGRAPLEVGRPCTSLRLTEPPLPWWRPFSQQARGVEQFRTDPSV